MAQRRMFSPKITSTDIFLDMPVSSRELYFQLGMNADDDGFITPKKIMRMIGASADDLNVLITKNFVIRFHSGVIVITAWKINNLVRRDWYQPTIYQEEMKLLNQDEHGRYKLVNEMLTEVRLGKVRLGKDSIDNNIEVPQAPPPKKTKEKKHTDEEIKIAKLLIDKFNIRYKEIHGADLAWNAKEFAIIYKLMGKFPLDAIITKMKRLEIRSQKDDKFNIFLPSVLLNQWNRLV